MSTAPGAVAKALLDALPVLDYNKIVNEARKSFNIAVIGEPEKVELVIQTLRGHTNPPDDVKLALWQHEPGESAPENSGKTDFVIIVPATDQFVRAARDAFAGAQLILVTLGGAPAPDGSVKPIDLPVLDERQIQRHLVPHLVDRLWDRRLSLGRAVPATRDAIASRLTKNAASEPKVLLGSVAGAGANRSGAPTPATAVVMLHQAALIVTLAAVYGANLDDRTAIFTRVAPGLAPTMLMDGAEMAVSKFADQASKGSRYEKIAGPAAAYILRPTLTFSSTFLAGITARRIFRAMSRAEEPKPGPIARTRAAGKRAVLGAGHVATVVGGTVAMRVRRDKHAQPVEVPPESPADAELPETVAGDQTSTTSSQ